MGEPGSVEKYNEKTGKWEKSSRKKMGNTIQVAGAKGARRNPAFMRN